MLIAFDIDGTLANLDHRLRFIQPVVGTVFTPLVDGIENQPHKIIHVDYLGKRVKAQNIDKPLHYATLSFTEIGFTPNWNGFFANTLSDEPIKEMVNICNTFLFNQQHEIIFVTGRSSECRDDTIAWLRRYTAVTARIGGERPQDLTDMWDHPMLFMRSEGDHRPDYKVKKDLIEEIIGSYGYKPDMTFDDRDQVVKMWRDQGIRCCQVAEGAF